MTTTTEETQKPKRRILWGNLALGLLIFLPAVAGASFDLYNNCLFGWDKSFAIAGTLVLGAVGLVVFPIATNGWNDVHFIGLTLICAVLCIFAGYKNHTASEENHALHEKAITDAYNKAQSDIATLIAEQKQFQAKAEAIGEQLGSKALADLVESKKQIVTKECAVRGPRCRKAEEELEGYQKREGDAKAKEEAQRRADKARDDLLLIRSPEQPKAAGMSTDERTFFAIILLFASVGAATAAHRGWHYLASCVTYEQPKPVKKPAPAKKPELEQPKEEKKSDLQRAVEACFEVIDNEAEEWMSPEKALNRVHTYYDQHHPKKAKPTKTALGTAMGEKGAKFPKGKVNGQQRYGVRFTKLAKVA